MDARLACVGFSWLDVQLVVVCCVLCITNSGFFFPSIISSFLKTRRERHSSNLATTVKRIGFPPRILVKINPLSCSSRVSVPKSKKKKSTRRAAGELERVTTLCSKLKPSMRFSLTFPTLNIIHIINNSVSRSIN